MFRGAPPQKKNFKFDKPVFFLNKYPKNLGTYLKINILTFDSLRFFRQFFLILSKINGTTGIIFGFTIFNSLNIFFESNDEQKCTFVPTLILVSKLHVSSYTWLKGKIEKLLCFASAISLIASTFDIMFSWLNITPLGSPVVPEVKSIKLISFFKLFILMSSEVLESNKSSKDNLLMLLLKSLLLVIIIFDSENL